VALAAGITLLGCSAERLPFQPPPVTGDRPALLMALVSQRPPAPSFTGDVWFYDVASGDSAYLPANLNASTEDGPCAFSADGEWLALYSIRNLVGTIATVFLYHIPTRELSIPRAINTLQNVLNPTLSADGRYLAGNFQIGGPFDQYIVVSDVVADTLLPVPNINEPNATNFDPSISGDGTLIAFSQNGTRSVGGFDVMLYSIPGDSLIQLPGLNSPANDSGPAISTDGRFIAFQSGRAGGAGLIDIYLYDRTLGTLVPLPGVNTEFSDLHPSLSPDGRYLAYGTEATGGIDVRLYDTLTQRHLTITGANDPFFPDRWPELTIASPPAQRARATAQP
jgi:hypothetical protein